MNEKDTRYAKWLNGELDSSELERLQQSGELEELESIINVVDDLTLPNYNLEGAYQQFKSRHSAKEVKVVNLRRRKWAIGVAASLLLLVATLFLLNNSEQRVFAENNTTQEHTFIDGSSVVLNDGSAIRFDKNKWNAQRNVHLTGEAFFTVEKGNSFVVQTPNGQVEVLGTGFNVRAWGKKLYVECYHGKVRVKYNDQEAVLTKNESVNVSNGKMEAKGRFIHEEPLWSKGISRFNNENLNEVFAELERQYGVTVNTGALNRVFSGSFQHDDLKEAVNHICKPLGLQYTISDDGKVVFIDY